MPILRNPTPAQVNAIRNDPNTKWYPGATGVNRQNQPVNSSGNVVPAAGSEFPTNIFDNVSSAFTSVTDFLGFIAWFFHPLNWLRAVEFLVGLLLAGYGIMLLTSRRSGGVTGIARRTISMTPVGREIRMAQGARMGRHEGQREAARMEARQRETRSARQSSADERERINLDARRRARET